MKEILWTRAAHWQGRWEQVRPIASGRHGHGFAAVRTGDPMRREFFLKIMRHDGPAATPQRFRAEAKALAALSHPSVPQLIEANAGPDGAQDTDALYFVTTLIEGVTLEERLAGRRPLLEEEAFDFTEGLLGILQHCRAHGQVHGDLNPANVMLRSGNPGDPVLVDFSASSVIGQGTATLAQQPWRDPRNDVMQAARLLLACLTGHYNSPLRDWFGRAPHERPHDLGGLRSWSGPRAPHLRSVFDRAFDIAMERRFQSAEELRIALHQVRATPVAA